MTELPIAQLKTKFLHALQTQPTLVLSAPPGAGKSTGLPLWLLRDAPWLTGNIYLLQPRRVAVKTIASFLAKQLGEAVGQTVGYRLRNDSKISANTRLEVITEAILTQIMQQDAELTATSLVIFDEFHERSLHGDLAFALARDIQQGLRADLKILLMSATLATEQLLMKLPDATRLTSDGRSFAVEISYQAPPTLARWRDHALQVIKQQALPHQGSCLVFLPGVADIRYLAQQLAEFMPADLELAPLYGDLSLAQQQRVLAAPATGQRKLVLATNIAETSLTIDGVSLVIDSGLEKIARFNRASMMNQLVQQQITKSSAVQRAGRAGRLMPGKCIRLYSADDFQRRPEHAECELRQADLLPVLIEVARWGVNSMTALPFLELPNAHKQQQAWAELRQLELVNRQHKLTQHGQQVAQLSCHPRLGHMLVHALALQHQCTIPHLSGLACLVAAMLEERDWYRGEQAKMDANLAHRILDICRYVAKPINTPESAILQRIVKQSQSLAKQLNSVVNFEQTALPLSHLASLLALAYPERIAKARAMPGQFLCRNGKGCRLEVEDALASETYLVAANLVQINQQLVVRLAAPLSVEHLLLCFADQIKEQTSLQFDATNGKIIARVTRCLDAIVLSEQPCAKSGSEQAVAQLWQNLVQQQGLAFLPWPDKALTLLTRWRWLTQYVPQAQLPQAAETQLLAQMATWFTPFVGKCKSLAQLAKLDFSTMLLSLLDYQQQQQLSQLAPTHFIGPTGRKCPINYHEQRSPKVTLPMQELYGVVQTPTIASTHQGAGIPLLLELISPAGRPIQITQDLVAFWQGSYRQVQKDMKAQYPKHYWPDDPANAKATNKTKRHLVN